METIDKAIKCRMEGKTYQEINEVLGKRIPKATYTYWFKNISIPLENQEKLRVSIDKKLIVARQKAVNSNKVKRGKYLASLDQINSPISKRIDDQEVAKIALAMLCLGEASKSVSSSGFCLGNSDPRIIVLFIKLLKYSFPTDQTKFRFTIQCRADQSTEELEKYWRKVVGIEVGQFYKARIDPRTIGKPTLDKEYKGVLRVDYIDRKIQLELESLANMIYNHVASW